MTGMLAASGYTVQPGRAGDGPERFPLTLPGLEAAVSLAAHASAGSQVTQQVTVTRGAASKIILAYARGRLTWAAGGLAPAAPPERKTGEQEKTR